MLTVRQNLDTETKIEIFKSLALDYKKNNDNQKSKIEAEKILEIDKTNIWANEFLLSLAEETEHWDYAEKKARDLKKIKGFDDDVGLSKYTLQKGNKLRWSKLISHPLGWTKEVQRSYERQNSSCGRRYLYSMI